jgi:hypothetical protein
MWRSLLEAGGSRGVTPGLLRELGIYGGAQGIWVDKARTSTIMPEGVAVGLLHTGSSYADDLADDGVIYHYPQTGRASGGRDAAEVAAVRAAQRLRLPVFVVVYPWPKASTRDVRVGWVVGDDAKEQWFLVEFGELAAPPEPLSDNVEDTPFDLEERQQRREARVRVRPGQARFQFEVFRRYGGQCAVCGVSIKELLDAAHLRGKRDRGCDDPRNGLVLCATHHRAFNCGFFAFEPRSGELHVRNEGPTPEALQITRRSLQHLPKQPHEEALGWRWARWKIRQPTPGINGDGEVAQPMQNAALTAAAS